MTDPNASRVAVYLDFDNIVISRYDQVHGRNSFQRDKSRRGHTPDAAQEADTAAKLGRATVDIGAVIDFASSFGTLVLTRAYADWSAAVNAGYRGQLVGRAVDLVQLFPTAAYAKNGADIRLAVDAVEDMFRLPDLTHVVIVAGDSDYIALAQRCKRLGRYVIGIGVAGASSKSLAAACDEFVTYDDLPNVLPPAPEPATAFAPTAALDPATTDAAAPDASGQPASGQPASGPDASAAAPAEQQPEPTSRRRRRVSVPAPSSVADDLDDQSDDADDSDDGDEPEDSQAVATGLLERALRLGHEKDDADWLHNSAVKTQMKRMDPSFSEKALGYRSFSDFLRSRGELVTMDESSTARLVRLASLVPTP